MYINNDAEHCQMLLLIKYQAQVFHLLHDCQGYQGIERTIALCHGQFYWNTIFQDATYYVKKCPWSQSVKGVYTYPKNITRYYNSH